MVRIETCEMEKEVQEKEMQKQRKSEFKHADESKHVIKAIFDSTQSFIILISPDYRIMFFNKRALQYSKFLHGKDLQIGEYLMDYKRPEDEDLFASLKENFSKAILTGYPVTSEYKMRFDNMVRWLRSEYTPVYDEDKIIGVSLRIVDITESKQKELQIERQNEYLRQISWMQSHLTRQPVATIKGLIHILDKKSLTEDNQRIIAMLEETVEKLDEVIGQTIVRANKMYQNYSNNKPE